MNVLGPLDVTGKLLAARPFPSLVMLPTAGQYVSNAMNGLSLTTAGQVTDRTIISAYVPGRTIQIDELTVCVSTAGATGAAVKTVIYGSDDNGRPTTVLAETASLPADTAGPKSEVLSSSITLRAGEVYWFGIRSLLAPTLRCIGPAGVPMLALTNAGNPALYISLILTETFATPAAPWTYSTAQRSTLQPPIVIMRIT